VTLVLSKQSNETATHETTPDGIAGDASVVASWWARAGAFGVDVLIGLGTIAPLILLAWSTAQRDWLWWVYVVTAALILLTVAVNRLLLPTITGWSLGRALFGIAVVSRDGGDVGPWRLLARDAGHLIDTLALFLGWLWPLWDSRGRTFADVFARTEVRRVDPKPLTARRIVVIAVSVCAGVAVVAAALGYATVYRHDLRLAQAREQLAVQGPRLVTDMLSYNATTLQEDFDRAKSVVTDNYRPQLEQQQAAILQASKENAAKSPVVDNAYWSTNASVLTSAEDRGTMLIFLQGQRGTPPDMRTITATVKADFERVGDGQWKLNSLTVLAKPQPTGGGR
jgi:Mce-associated membrane protein